MTAGRVMSEREVVCGEGSRESEERVDCEGEEEKEGVGMEARVGWMGVMGSEWARYQTRTGGSGERREGSELGQLRRVLIDLQQYKVGQAS